MLDVLHDQPPSIHDHPIHDHRGERQPVIGIAQRILVWLSLALHSPSRASAVLIWRSSYERAIRVASLELVHSRAVLRLPGEPRTLRLFDGGVKGGNAGAGETELCSSEAGDVAARQRAEPFKDGNAELMPEVLAARLGIARASELATKLGRETFVESPHRAASRHSPSARASSSSGAPPARCKSRLAPDTVDMTGEPHSFVELDEGRRLMVRVQQGPRLSTARGRPSPRRGE